LEAVVGVAAVHLVLVCDDVIVVEIFFFFASTNAMQVYDFVSSVLIALACFITSISVLSFLF
jgi:hypothetical protein